MKKADMEQLGKSIYRTDSFCCVLPYHLAALRCLEAASGQTTNNKLVLKRVPHLCKIVGRKRWRLFIKSFAHINSMVLLTNHYGAVIMGAIASQITSFTTVDSTVSDADQRKHQSTASLAFVRGIHRGSVNSPHKWPVTRKMFPFDDVIMCE